MRALVIFKYKELVDKKNKYYDWDKNFEPIKYPYFETMSDEELLSSYTIFLTSMCSPEG